MPRLVLLLIILALLIGALVFLSSQARDVPTKTIEVDVSRPANGS